MLEIEMIESNISSKLKRATSVEDLLVLKFEIEDAIGTMRRCLDVVSARCANQVEITGQTIVGPWVLSIEDGPPGCGVSYKRVVVSKF